MRKIAATYIFPGDEAPLKNGILVCQDDGTIVDVIEKGNNFAEEAGTEFYSGILVPGFVNTHCHLELSHLKGKISEKTGIGGFIGEINRMRNQEDAVRNKAMHLADKKMWASGTAVVGDISNSILSLDTKLKSPIFYHTLVEAFGFHPDRAEKSFSYAKLVFDDFRGNHLPASIVPHSPYSVSEELFVQISEYAQNRKSILSIHNQESKGEAEFYKTGTGPIADHLTNNLGIDISHWNPTGKSSLQSILKYFPAQNQLLLVHNTFTEKEDIQALQKERPLNNTWFVLCPNSNVYIENQLPPVYLFQQEKLNICLGTDSLASNHQLSMLEEMITLQLNFPELLLEDLISWATINGAKALLTENIFGSFKTSKKPGINLITGIDFQHMRLTENSKVKRLL